MAEHELIIGDDSLPLVGNVVTISDLDRIIPRVIQVLFEAVSVFRRISNEREKAEELIVNSNKKDLLSAKLSEPAILEAERIETIGFLADGRPVAVTSEKATQRQVLRLQEIANDKVLRVFDLGRPCRTVKLSKDGSHLAIFCTHGSKSEVQVWEIASSRLRKRVSLNLGSSMEWDFDCRDDGELIAVATYETRSRKGLSWESPYDVDCIKLFRPGGFFGGDLIRTIDYTGQRVIPSSSWELLAVGKITRYLPDKSDPGIIARYLLDISDPSIKVVKVEDGSTLWSRKQSDQVFEVTFSADNQMLASAGGDKVRIWRVSDGEELISLNYPTEDARNSAEFRTRSHEKYIWRIHSLTFTRDGKTLITSAGDDTIRFWDIGTGEEVGRVIHPPLSDLMLSRNSNYLVGQTGNTALLWHVLPPADYARITVAINERMKQALTKSQQIYDDVLKNYVLKDLAKPIPESTSFACHVAWDNERWQIYQPSHAVDTPICVHIGKLVVEQKYHYARFPFLVPIIGHRGLMIQVGSHTNAIGEESIQVVLFRLLATLPPAKLHFTFIDPVGLGQNVAPFMHLADYDEQLVTGKAWTEPQHIEQRLADLTEHMENVIQKYLRNQFATIEDYNAQAGEVAEPYRVLVVMDFPANFSEAAARRLVSIAQNGPRCGVYAVILVDTDKPLPYNFNLADLERASTVIAWDNSQKRFV
jgi:WD40 repeat protein